MYGRNPVGMKPPVPVQASVVAEAQAKLTMDVGGIVETCTRNGYDGRVPDAIRSALKTELVQQAGLIRTRKLVTSLSQRRREMSKRLHDAKMGNDDPDGDDHTPIEEVRCCDAVTWEYAPGIMEVWFLPSVPPVRCKRCRHRLPSSARRSRCCRVQCCRWSRRRAAAMHPQAANGPPTSQT